MRSGPFGGFFRIRAGKVKRFEVLGDTSAGGIGATRAGRDPDAEDIRGVLWVTILFQVARCCISYSSLSSCWSSICSDIKIKSSSSKIKPFCLALAEFAVI